MIQSGSYATFSDLVSAYKRSPGWVNLAEVTKLTYRKSLERLLEIGTRIPIDMQYAVAGSRSPIDVATWNVAIMNLTISNNEKNKLFTLLNTILGSVGLGTVKFGKRLPHTIERHKPWDKESIEKLWQTQLTVAQRVAVAFTRACFYTAMRPWCEMAPLQWTEVGGLIEVLGSKRREAGKVSRLVSITKEVEECLEFMKQMVPGYSAQGYVWVTDRGKRVQKDTLRLRMKEACSLAGVEYREMYDGRRGFITSKLREGCSHADVADYVGHKDVNTTRGYDRRTMEEKALVFKGE